MSTILDSIVASKRLEVEAKKHLGLERGVEEVALRNHYTPVSLKQALLRSKGGIIAEFKRRSPSRDAICPKADPITVVKDYELNGATACSVLTDTIYFGGSLSDLVMARSRVTLPLLRKDFIIDPMQVYEARIHGADAILLIAAMLSRVEIKDLTATAHSLGLEVVLELHDEYELNKIIPEVDVIGVNNRNLHDFSVNINTSLRLLPYLPREAAKISESGITTADDIRRLRRAGFDGFLIGSSFMETGCPGVALHSFITSSQGK